MLKKAGILVAATAAGLLAVSPLAFAGDKGGWDGDHDGNNDRQVNRVDNDRDSSQVGLVNVGDVNALNDVNVCPAIPVAAGIGNILGILGSGAADADADGTAACVNDDSVNQANFED
ncbi:hypothetical protein [Pseudonocardia abyssalis]|uniref:Small secreted domain DUF320 n=1 Tax=Pseudonocardia abyssalis TaxID=2792008 RepID=A0ABS6UMW8_9PSEU|nr:hypothetical protein [Pseudonocardia abyssalis]MBW0117475.1 hypothetical protein [Pseudonocardia abyssalis]MBW0133547.1 hypothetical protein [Pseudonocardia abyssalis]